jgi:hypothetical protein
MKLTDLGIKAAKPRAKPFKISDSHGLFLLVNPGGSKLWRWRYRFGRREVDGLGRISDCESCPRA